MQSLGKPSVLSMLSALAVVSALTLSGCGGSSTPPQKNIKPQGYSSPEEEAKLKAMTANTPKLEPPKPEDLTKKKKGAKKK